MKVQYLGDVNDYRKFGLLRLFMQIPDLKIGVCWLLTPDDRSNDGRKRQYLLEDAEAKRDRPLFNLLKGIKSPPDEGELIRIESNDIFSGIRFFNKLTPDQRDERTQFHRQCLEHLKHVDLVFFDPDNGIEIQSRPVGRKHSNKYVLLNELQAHWTAGKSLLIYQHFTRQKREQFIDTQCHRLCEKLQISRANILALTTPQVVFFLIMQTKHKTSFEEQVSSASSGWPFSKSVTWQDKLMGDIQDKLPPQFLGASPDNLTGDHGWLLRFLRMASEQGIPINLSCGICCNDDFLRALDDLFRSKFSAPTSRKKTLDLLPLNKEMLEMLASELELIGSADLIVHQGYIRTALRYLEIESERPLSIRKVQHKIQDVLRDNCTSTSKMGAA